MYYLHEVNLKDATFFHNIATGWEEITDGFFLSDIFQLVHAEAKENSVVITLKLEEQIEELGEVLEPGKYQLIYTIHNKDDGTFRVGNYEIKNLETGKIIGRG